MYLFAQLISWILSPLSLIILLVTAAVARTQATQAEKILIISIVFGIGIVPSLVALVYLKTTGRISDWNISNRKERFTFILLVILFVFLTLITLQIANLPYLNYLLFTLLAGGLFFTAITYVTKISAHTSAAMLVYLYFLHWYGAIFAWGFILVVLVSWSRLYLKKHTMIQVLLGLLLSFLLFTVVKSLYLV